VSGGGVAAAELYLFDDARARDWQPFALTRPIGELLLGAHTFRRRAERVLGARCAGHITAAHLSGFEEPEAAPVVMAESIDSTRPRLFVSSRVVLAWGQAVRWPATRATLRIGDETVGCYVPGGSANPDASWFEEPRAHRGDADVALEGRVLHRVWELVAENAGQIAQDVTATVPAAATGGGVPDGCHAIGYHDGALRTGSGVTIEPGVMFDFTGGPIWLDEGVTVRALTRLAGPAYVGRGSTLLGGSCTALSIGPGCKIHGEVEEAVILGYSNKAHDGFLGHAYLGRWVNLGALTTNSDLKNNYGSIRMWTPAGEVDTGLMKLGCLLGDHVKTGIGALLNTGTVIGAGTNVFGTAMPPKYVPPFSWGSGAELVAFDVDRFLALAETVMGRRAVALTDGMRGMLRAAWQRGRESA
jgi:UDP-N-acetylglucosamine diphosphorylase / glucose-1-phosphate thymidylyltransferase / UDP-N-acetylgalactosamine diphosphorylase / glucosamine-1-phosphate N-acetyltransferase / galactosamine-1-phosphate N-acetyltransferase